jgi:hypothetical protein
MQNERTSRTDQPNYDVEEEQKVSQVPIGVYLRVDLDTSGVLGYIPDVSSVGLVAEEAFFRPSTAWAPTSPRPSPARPRMRTSAETRTPGRPHHRRGGATPPRRSQPPRIKVQEAVGTLWGMRVLPWASSKLPDAEMSGG